MRSRAAVVSLLAVAVVGCADDRSAPRSTSAHRAPAAERSEPSRPIVFRQTLVRLERFDGTFGRHDTLIVRADGAASLQLAHGGGGFRQKRCQLDRESLSSLRRDLRRAPIDGPRRRVPGYANPPQQNAVIVARPPVYMITYRGRRQVFGGRYLAVDGAPIAEHLERILHAREGTCRVTFHRP